jgi:O-antigen ligase
MTATIRVTWAASLATGVLVLMLLVARPTVGLMLVIAAIAVVLAARSPAIPLAFFSAGALPAVVLTGRLPQGATVAAFGVWNLLALFIAFVRSGRLRRPLLRDVVGIPLAATAALVALMLIRLSGSGDPSYGSQKIQLTFLTIVVPFLLAMIVGRSSREILRFLRWFIVLESAAAIYALYLLSSGSLHSFAANRFTVATSVDPIEIARDMGAFAIVLLFAMAHTRQTRTQVGYALIAITALVTLLASGSRAPFVALVIGTGVLLATRASDPRIFRRMARVVGVLIALGTVAIVTLVPGSALERALSVFGGDTVGGGEVRRVTLWHEAVQAASQNLWTGLGTGGYAAIEPHGLLYPHNIFLEVFAELGLFALVLLVLALGAGTLRVASIAFSRRPGSSVAGLMTALLVFAIFNACFSGDLTTNGQIWVWLGIGLAQATAAVRQPAWRLRTAASTA